MTRSRVSALIGVGIFFVLWHFPLLTPAGRIRGFNSDAAILGLMGKKMLEGRGFDVFFWGQNYIGPFTSMLVAGWGAMLREAGPLALRLATFTIALGGIFLTWAAVRQIDGRAALATAIALAITPPVLLRMVITPLGAEMAFIFGAALLAVLMRGWPSSATGQMACGALAGVAWWMNQQVVFTLLAGAIVLFFRSRSAEVLVKPWKGGARRLPGVVQAAVWFLTSTGVFLLLAFLVLDLFHRSVPFVFGHVVDPLLLIVLGQLPLLFLIPWRSLPRDEIASVARFALGAAIGYAPVWLGVMLGWYERSYVFGFQPNYPSAVVARLRELPPVLAHWTGIAPGAIGSAFAVALALLAIVGFLQARTPARAMLALIVAGNVAFYLIASGPKPHYLISSIGPLYALASLAAFYLWDRYGIAVRGAVVATGVTAAISIGLSARAMHRDVLAEPDPLPLLARVRSVPCAVVYADFWIAYRYRFLDGEQRAWIPYRSQNRALAESEEMQKLPGQRCLARKDGWVYPIGYDLPLKYAPPRHGR